MKFAKASITRRGSCGSDSSAYSQKGRGGDFRFCSLEPDPRSRDGSPEKYHDAAAVRDVTKLWSGTRCSCAARISGPGLSGTLRTFSYVQLRCSFRFVRGAIHTIGLTIERAGQPAKSLLNPNQRSPLKLSLNCDLQQRAFVPPTA